MKQFSLLVRVPNSYNAEQVQIVIPQWTALIEQWKKDGAYVLSFPFPAEGYTISGAEKIIKKETVFANNLKVVSNVVLQAENMEQVLELSKLCPVLPYGGTIEVREISRPVQITND